MVYGVWCMEYGVWSMVSRSMVYGVRCTVYGVWCMEYVVWCIMSHGMVYGVRCMEYGVLCRPPSPDIRWACLKFLCVLAKNRFLPASNFTTNRVGIIFWTWQFVLKLTTMKDTGYRTRHFRVTWQRTQIQTTLKDLKRVGYVLTSCSVDESQVAKWQRQVYLYIYVYIYICIYIHMYICTYLNSEGWARKYQRTFRSDFDSVRFASPTHYLLLL